MQTKRSLIMRVCVVISLVVVAAWAGVSRADVGAMDDMDHDHPDPTVSPTVTPAPPPPTTPPPTTPGQQTKKIKYGPFNIPAAPVNPDGKHGHAHTGNQFQFGIQKPCTGCYITGMTADMKYADGSTANWNTDAQLHHMVLFNQAWGRSDATCGFSFLGFLGQRFFASGNERTPIKAQPYYGYKVGWFDNWNMIYELANEKTSPQSVYIEMTWDYVSDMTPGMKDIEPVWLDVDQCGDSEFYGPAGPSTHSYTWTVNRPGKIMGLGGHIHDGGIKTDITNDSTGQLLCSSVAGYGESPAYIGHHGEPHISSMSTCGGAGRPPVGTISNGQRITIKDQYNLPESQSDIMDIVIMYVAQS